MRVRLSADRADAIEDLADWLCYETELRGHVHAAPADPSPSELGTATDALVVAVGSGGALSVLAASLRAWLAQPHRANVKLRVERPDGIKIELDAENVRNVEALLRVALEDGHAAP